MLYSEQSRASVPQSKNNSVRVLVPEITNFAGKTPYGSRPPEEKIAVLSAGDRLSVLGCNRPEPAEGPLTDAWYEASSDREFLTGALVTHRRVLVNSRYGTLLLFADWLPAQRLIAVFPQEPIGEITRVLNFVGRRNFVLPPLSCPETSPEPNHFESLCDRLLRLLNAMDIVLSTGKKSPEYVKRCKILTAIAGLSPDYVQPEVLPPEPPSEAKRILCYADLFAGFLRRRRKELETITEQRKPH